MATAQTELTTAQTELIEKLNCLEFETSQLIRAYQLWRSYVEQGKAPDWMAAAIRITYDDLIKFCLGTVSTFPADVPHAFSARHLAQLEAGEISGILREESTTAHPKLRNTGAARGPRAEPSPELLPKTEPDWSGPEMPVATSPPSTGDTISEQPAIQQGQEKCNCRECARAREEEAGAEISGIWGEESTTAHPKLRNTGAAREPRAEPSPELLPVTEPDWSGPEMPVAISPPSTGDTISEQPASQQGRQEEEAGAELAAIHIPATLANWLQGASTGRLFRAASVAIVMVAGFAMGIYLASAHRAARRSAILSVQNSAAQPAAGAVAIPTGEKAEFKFDPDPVVAPLGSSFVLNAVLSRGSDIASMAVQIDYDANLLKFMGVSEGGFLVKHGQQVVLGQHHDPLTGVLKVSAEQSPGNPGISGDGPVFALSFQARKKGKATVSIVPGAHDSQGRRIEMAGSQVSVRVN